MIEDNLNAIPFEAPALEELDILLAGYKFESFIAQGGMGAVYLAKQTSLDRQVAIKVLPRRLGNDVKFRESFQSEAKHMAKLNHSNLIGIYDFGDIDGMLYIIMEFVDGKSLHEAAKGQPIMQEFAAEIVKDICHGLDHAHDAGILHRDIKPGNILLDKNLKPKIGDFGLARPTGNVETGVIYGTPGYAAPEVLNASDLVDARTDIFAIGVMFYELLTGQLPDEAYVPAYQLTEVHPKLDNIIRKAIQPEQSMRYASASDLAEDITIALNEIEAEKSKPANPLLSSGHTGAVPSPLAAGASGLATGVTNPAISARATYPPKAAKPSGGSNFKKIIIILILLGAVYAALQIKDKKLEEAEANRSPIEKLSDSKSELFGGDRAKELFPDSVVFTENGDRAVMFIDKPMTWDEADHWASEFGAYLAICRSQTDFSDHSKLITRETKAWLGAGSNGKKGWAWVDGSKWDNSVTLDRPEERSFVALANDGKVSKINSKHDRLPFFIEWRMKKDTLGVINPGSVEQRLARASRAANGEEFPVGSVNTGSRTYCPVYAKVSYRKAQQLADATGGHLLVISDKGELSYLRSFIARQIQHKKSCWLGGELSDGVWSWNTGEKWLEIPWRIGFPVEGKDADVTFLQFLTGGTMKLQNAGGSAQADMFIIEWSDDKLQKTKEKEVAIEVVETEIVEDKGLIKLNAWHKAKLQKELGNYEKKFASNIKRFKFDLEVYLKNLPRREGEAIQYEIEDLESELKDAARFPKSLDGKGPTPEVIKMTSYAISKQNRIQENLEMSIDKLRRAYIQGLKKYRLKVSGKEKQAVIESIDKNIKSAGDNADDYISHFEQ